MPFLCCLQDLSTMYTKAQLIFNLNQKKKTSWYLDTLKAKAKSCQVMWLYTQPSPLLCFLLFYNISQLSVLLCSNLPENKPAQVQKQKKRMRHSGCTTVWKSSPNSIQKNLYCAAMKTTKLTHSITEFQRCLQLTCLSSSQCLAHTLLMRLD